MMRFAVSAIAVVCLCGWVAQAQESPDTTRISQFSGKPVPRFESLRYNAAHGRVGPSLDHPIVWKYERKGLPVLIVKESNDWRFVRDPDGDEVWIHARMLSGEKTVMVRSDVPMRRLNSEDAKPVAALREGVIAKLERCELAWCLIKADRLQGWVLRAKLWGGNKREAGL